MGLKIMALVSMVAFALVVGSLVSVILKHAWDDFVFNFAGFATMALLGVRAGGFFSLFVSSAKLALTLWFVRGWLRGDSAQLSGLAATIIGDILAHIMLARASDTSPPAKKSTAIYALIVLAALSFGMIQWTIVIEIEAIVIGIWVVIETGIYFGWWASFISEPWTRAAYHR